MKIKLSNYQELRAFAHLKLQNDFKFIIDGHCYYMPQNLADYLSPVVADMHFADPTLNYFEISDICDDNSYFELFMKLAVGKEIEITNDNCTFIEAVASKLMIDELLTACFEFTNTISPITIKNAVSRLLQNRADDIYPIGEIKYISENFWLIDPDNLFQLEPNDLSLIFSFSGFKVISENWFFYFLVKLIEMKGDSYHSLLGFVVFPDLTFTCIQKFIEHGETQTNDAFVLNYLHTQLSRVQNSSYRPPSHHSCDLTEIRLIYKQSQNDTGLYSFNKDFFKKFMSFFDDSENDDDLPSFVNENNHIDEVIIRSKLKKKFDPFKPKVEKIYPDEFKHINYYLDDSDSYSDDDFNHDLYRRYRHRLIKDNSYVPIQKKIDVKDIGKSEQIPINIKPKESSDDSENSNELIEKLVDESFQQTVNYETEKPEQNNEKENGGFWGHLVNYFFDKNTSKSTNSESKINDNENYHHFEVLNQDQESKIPVNINDKSNRDDNEGDLHQTNENNVHAEFEPPLEQFDDKVDALSDHQKSDDSDNPLDAYDDVNNDQI